jgi:hypothetical protein
MNKEGLPSKERSLVQNFGVREFFVKVRNDKEYKIANYLRTIVGLTPENVLQVLSEIEKDLSTITGSQEALNYFGDDTTCLSNQASLAASKRISNIKMSVVYKYQGKKILIIEYFVLEKNTNLQNKGGLRFNTRKLNTLEIVIT